MSLCGINREGEWLTLFIHLFIYSFIYLFIHSFIYLVANVQVIWLLSGHTAIPNVTNDPRHAEWDDLHSSILEAVAERGDTVEVTFWKPQSKAAPPAAGVGTPAVTNVDD
jgi:hypothetical protein